MSASVRASVPCPSQQVGSACLWRLADETQTAVHVQLAVHLFSWLFRRSAIRLTVRVTVLVTVHFQWLVGCSNECSDGCSVGWLWLSGGCPVAVRRLSGGCPVAVRRLSGGCPGDCFYWPWLRQVDRRRSGAVRPSWPVPSGAIPASGHVRAGSLR